VVKGRPEIGDGGGGQKRRREIERALPSCATVGVLDGGICT